VELFANNKVAIIETSITKKNREKVIEETGKGNKAKELSVT